MRAPISFISHTGKGRRLRSFVLLVLCALGLLPQICLAQEAGEAEEYQAKTALIYNFAKFVTWPKEAYANDDAPFVIATLGDNPFGIVLNCSTARRCTAAP